MTKYYKKCEAEDCSKCERDNSKTGCPEFMYKVSQYEDYNEGIFSFAEHVNARYIEQDEPDYKGNPLIEALPPQMNMLELLNALERNPRYTLSEREMSEEYRINAILRLKKSFFFMFSKHIEIYNKLSLVIRGGYEGRHIMTPEFIKRVNFTSSLLNDKWIKNKLEQISCISSYSDIAMDGWSLIGMSGEGKTVALNTLLTTLPQVIVHTEYNGNKFLFYQLTWLKIDCTSKATVKQICMKFFGEVDRVLGTRYAEKHGHSRCSVDNMIVAMCHITQIHGLGALVIDEIQHLASSRNGIEEVLNFLVTLKNEMKIPIIYIGTFKVTKSVLGKNFTQARRASGIGEIIWNPMLKEEEWDDFVSRMWTFQWTKQECPLTEELSKLFYEFTMGITDRAIKLYMAVQIEAIMSSKEEITAALIKEVVQKNMPLTSDMICALKERDIKKLAAYDDLKTFDIEEYVEEARKKKEYQKVLKKEKEKQIYLANQKKLFIENELVLIMLQKGISESIAEKAAKGVVNEFGLDKDFEFLVKEAGRKIESIKNGKKESRLGNKKDSKENGKDEEPKLGYDKVKEQGLIKPM
ncbi:MAG: ATPase central domain protein [Anaerocolumna sp.]|jgi:hypothetical protein|nr:ATPase central domain protein [Anaerocolumna sp.]